MPNYNTPYWRNRAREMKSDNSKKIIEIVIVVAIIAIVVTLFAMPPILGIKGFGPEKTLTAKVISKHIDYSSNGDGGTESHYMVITDKGTFEVQNGMFLGVYNADEIYGRMKEDKHYNIRTKGNRVVGYYYQEYPYILNAVEAK